MDNLTIASEGNLDLLIKELEALLFRIKHLKHGEELTVGVLERILKRLKS